MGAYTSYSSTLLLQMDYVLCPFQKLSESYQGRIADMGRIEAHRKRRQVELSKLCVSFSVNARRLIVCAKHICLAEINSDVCVLKFSTRRSLYKLRLKFVQTTRVVCTDLAEVLILGSANTILCARTI